MKKKWNSHVKVSRQHLKNTSSTLASWITRSGGSLSWCGEEVEAVWWRWPSNSKVRQGWLTTASTNFPSMCVILIEGKSSSRASGWLQHWPTQDYKCNLKRDPPCQNISAKLLISYPQKLWAIITNYCLQPFSVQIICYLAMDN